MAAPETVASCYPLHPLSALVLPELCSRYGQHERTLFSFPDRKRFSKRDLISEYYRVARARAATVAGARRRLRLLRGRWGKHAWFSRAVEPLGGDRHATAGHARPLRLPAAPGQGGRRAEPGVVDRNAAGLAPGAGPHRARRSEGLRRTRGLRSFDLPPVRRRVPGLAGQRRGPRAPAGNRRAAGRQPAAGGRAVESRPPIAAGSGTAQRRARHATDLLAPLRRRH